MFELALFLLGLFFGSFFLVLADRLPRGEKVLMGRSHCEFCKKNINWMDLFPVISFIFLQGRCRYCKKKIGLRYPLVEVATGILFVLTYKLFILYPMPYPLSPILYTLSPMHYPLFPIPYYLTLGFYLFITGVFIVIFLSDMWYGIIPDAVLLPAVIITFLFVILNFKFMIISYIFAGFAAFGFFLLLFLLTKGKGIGFGDVKLAFLSGLLTGLTGVIISMYMAFVAGAVVSLILIALGRKKLRGDTIAFGPFMLLGVYVSIFYGNFLWQLLIKLFHFT